MRAAISPIQNPAYRRSRPTFCIPKTPSCGRQIAVAASDLAAARRLAESIQRRAVTVSRGQPSVRLRGAWRRTGQDREAPGSNPGPPTKFYYLNWPRQAWLLTPHVIAQI